MTTAIASIITIGDELLIGQVIDTNSAYIAQQLNIIGIDVSLRIAVGDNKEAIINALNYASKDAQIIIITGGLGPTADDITKPLLNEYFGGTLVVNDKVLRHVEAIFKKYKRPMLPVNKKQAEVPSTCTVLFNNNGTAPGMMFQKENKIFVSLPGVPYEMKGIMIDEVIPLLTKTFQQEIIIHKTLLTAGEGESFVAHRIKHIEESLPSYISLAYLPNYGILRLRLTLKGFKINETELKGELNKQFNLIKNELESIVISEEDITLPKLIGELLIEKKLTLATAESCTGGAIAQSITAIAGASSYFKGAVIAYCNDVKNFVLQVPESTLQNDGAVSEATVIKMASNAANLLHTNIAVAVSGIMGPSGGSEEKPVGTVWMAVANNEKVVTEKFLARFDRQKNIEITSSAVLLMLRKFIVENY